MIKEPKLIRQFLSAKEVGDFKALIGELKTSEEVKVDRDFFYRNYLYNPASLLPFHKFLTKFASNLVKQELEPTYSFISMYQEGQGDCPLHLDRFQCQLTVDICIDHAEPWPLFVNHKTAFQSEEDLVKQQDLIKAESAEYILHPGDALIYSGTDHPHWRNKIQAQNFCDLIFFHFIKRVTT